MPMFVHESGERQYAEVGTPAAAALDASGLWQRLTGPDTDDDGGGVPAPEVVDPHLTPGKHDHPQQPPEVVDPHLHPTPTAGLVEAPVLAETAEPMVLPAAVLTTAPAEAPTEAPAGTPPEAPVRPAKRPTTRRSAPTSRK